MAHRELTDEDLALLERWYEARQSSLDRQVREAHDLLNAASAPRSTSYRYYELQERIEAVLKGAPAWHVKSKSWRAERILEPILSGRCDREEALQLIAGAIARAEHEG